MKILKSNVYVLFQLIFWGEGKLLGEEARYCQKFCQNFVSSKFQQNCNSTLNPNLHTSCFISINCSVLGLIIIFEHRQKCNKCKKLVGNRFSCLFEIVITSSQLVLQFWQKCKIYTAQYIQFLTVLFFVVGGTKFSPNIAESFAKSFA